MRRFLHKALVVLLLPMLFSLSGCGGGTGGEPAPAAGTASPVTTPAEQQAKGTVTLSWDSPTDDSGAAVSDLAGYRLRYGTTAGSYPTTVDVGTATTCTVSDLQPGTYYFTVTAYDSSGNESGFSNEAIHRIL